MTVMPGFSTPVSTRPTGTVPMPPILNTRKKRSTTGQTLPAENRATTRGMCVRMHPLIHILEGQAEREIVGPLGGHDGIERLQEDGALVPADSEEEEEG